MSAQPIRDELFKLSAAERLLLVQDLWDSIAEDPTAWELTDAQKNELKRRLDAHREHRRRGESWEEVRTWVAQHDDR